MEATALTEASRRLVGSLSGLDLPDATSRDAAAEYQRIAGWLGAYGSPLAGLDLELYPQGSFRLGTPIRPIAHADEFDVDLVCQVGLTKEQVSQAALKSLVGDRLKKDPDARGKLGERRRCWTLGYAKRFHLDVLPTIPDQEHPGDGILITDTQLRLWQFSNPIGYANWFYNQMKTVLTEARTALAKSERVDIDRIPEWRVRTALQRAVQVLKRHRDIHFQRELDRRPVSIIITTLAAQSYQGQSDVAAALMHAVEHMEDFVEDRNGTWWVSNPTHAKENFADKWNEKPALRDGFLRWRDQVHEDMENLNNVVADADATLLLERALHGKTSTQPFSLAVSAMAGSIPALASIQHRKPLLWPLREAYECSISMRSRVPSGAGNWRFGTLNRVPKHASLEFTAKTNTPMPYDVWWQVTNTGSEAQQAGALRGGFEGSNGQGGMSRVETSLYYGTHTTQAFIVKNSVVVAKSREVRVRIEKK